MPEHAATGSCPPFFTPARRLWVYRVLVAAGPVVLVYGLMNTQEIAVWLGLGASILGTPAGALAASNTPKDKP